MQWILAGLGNPGKEYEGTRHNAGRELLLAINKKEGGNGKLFGKKALVTTPDVYMNNSGGPLKKLVVVKADASVGSPTASRRGKAAEQLVVVHDDIDLSLGTVKISFGSGSGGHRGVESIIKTLKTRDFVRVRVGISPSTASGKIKKPDSKKIVDFVLGKFRVPELEKLKKVKKTVSEALKLLLIEGRAAAMNIINSH